MIVALAATQLEMSPFLREMKREGQEWPTLITGVGPLETAVRLSRYLAAHGDQVSGLLQFGVGGAYLGENSCNKVKLLDVCLATREVMGDFGICQPDGIEPFSKELGGGEWYELDRSLTSHIAALLQQKDIDFHRGSFVTVNSVSATRKRGDGLANHWQGLCENMEGAAAARVCNEFGVKIAQLRVVSNMVEERNLSGWRLQEAADKAGQLAAQIIKELE